MKYDSQTLYRLLPAIYRIRDFDQGEVLKALLDMVAEQVAALEEDIDQAYDNLFIETCAEWAVPYIGDLIGYRGIHSVGGTIRTSRAEVANTIAYRRRKGTASVLEQLACDVTGWEAVAVEFFLRLITNQHLNHWRQNHFTTINLRDMKRLEQLNTPFDIQPHTVDVRRIASRRGKYNIPNIGIFLWRLGGHSWTNTIAAPATLGDTRRFLFHPLGINTPLFQLPLTQTSISQFAGPLNVPMPISRRAFAKQPDAYYGSGKSILILRKVSLPPGSLGPDLVPIQVQDIESCDLSDLDADPVTSAWPPGHATKVSIDPELGRIRFPADETEIHVVFHCGFSAELGGGEYGRSTTFTADPRAITFVPHPHEQIQDAVAAIAGSGTVEITGRGPFEQAPVIVCAANAQLEIRAADRTGSTLVLKAGDVLVAGGASSEVTLNGLLISHSRVIVPANIDGNPNRLQKLRLLHCTLVPGIKLHRDGSPIAPDIPSLIIDCPDTEVEISYCICGGIRAVSTAKVTVQDSIIDATNPRRIAYSAPDESKPGAPLTIESCTVIGKVHTTTFIKASNSIFLAETAPGDGWAAPVIASRRQQGCVRFSYVPLEAIVPRRYRCHPVDAAEAACLRPQFNSLRFGEPAYAQFALTCPDALWRGAHDGGELGAFHHLMAPQRESDLRTRLDEYLRFGLEAGIFYAT